MATDAIRTSSAESFTRSEMHEEDRMATDAIRIRSAKSFTRSDMHEED